MPRVRRGCYGARHSFFSVRRVAGEVGTGKIRSVVMVEFCSSNVLWFVNGCVGPDDLAHITSRDVATEFGVDEECACEQLSRLCEAGFIRPVPPVAYEVTQNGKNECAILSQFVTRGKSRKINP